MSKLLTSLKFGEWLPDLPEYDNPGSPLISNALWVNGGYVPANDFSALGASLGARVQGAYAAVDGSGNTHIYAGTATNLYEYNGSGFVSEGSGYTMGDGQSWKGTEFSSPGYPALLIMTNFSDPVQYMVVGASSFAPLSALGGTPPQAAACATVNQFIMLGNTEETSMTVA